MRRVVSQSLPRAAFAARCISNYDFGHPALDTEVRADTIGKDYPSADPSSNVLVPFGGQAQKDLAYAVISKGPQFKTLSNGARIVCHNRAGAHACVALYADAGAKHDSRGLSGMSYVMRHGLWMSNLQNSMFQINRQQWAVGAATANVELEKRLLGWKIEAPLGAWEKPFGDLCNCMVIPRFPEQDIEKMRDTFDNNLEETRWQDPRTYVVDKLEERAFYKEPLGQPRHVAPEMNNLINTTNLLEHWASVCVPSRVIIVGVNVDIDELAAEYENAVFTHSSATPAHAHSVKALSAVPVEELAQYIPGAEAHEQESRPAAMMSKPDMQEETIAAIGVPVLGSGLGQKDAAASLVFRELLDLAVDDGTRWNRQATHTGLRAFHRAFSGAGLAGYTVRNTPTTAIEETKEAVSLLKNAISNLASVLPAARERAAVRFFSEKLENTRDYADALASSVTATGLVAPEETLKAISAVSEADVKRVDKIAQGSKPSLFVTGHSCDFPSLKHLGY